MAKRKILVSDEQVNETRLINSLNSNLLKKEGEKTNSIKEESPVEENFKNVREKTLAETEPVTGTPQDEFPEPYAANACNCGTEIAEDNAPLYKIITDCPREIKNNTQTDKIGYANAGPSPVWGVILPEAESILKRFDQTLNALKDNKDSRKAINSEISNSASLTDYDKKIFEAGKIAGKIATGKDAEYEMVNHPTHYNQYDIEVIDMIIKIWGPEAAALWCDITAFKYRMRMGTKPDNSIEQDIKKEQWYLNKSKEIKAVLINENIIK